MPAYPARLGRHAQYPLVNFLWKRRSRSTTLRMAPRHGRSCKLDFRAVPNVGEVRGSVCVRPGLPACHRIRSFLAKRRVRIAENLSHDLQPGAALRRQVSVTQNNRNTSQRQRGHFLRSSPLKSATIHRSRSGLCCRAFPLDGEFPHHGLARVARSIPGLDLEAIVGRGSSPGR